MMRIVLLACGILAASAAPAATNSANLPPPRDLTAEQDHQLMLDQLGIPSLRQGANGRDPAAANAANYDETKRNPYPDLPEVLRLDNGNPVTTAKQWWKQRRPQLVEYFDREVYGRMPKKLPRVSWSVAETKSGMSGDKAVVTRKIVGHVDNAAYPLINVDIELFLTTPVGAKGVP